MILVFIISMALIFANSAPVHEVTIYAESEFGGYFEGDMILTEEQKKAVLEAMGSRHGLREGAKRWPDNTVAYYIDEDFNKEEVKTIKEAMADISLKSCITFRQAEGNEHAVIIKGVRNGCFSYVGYAQTDDSGEPIREQVLNLKPPHCVTFGTVVHELLHTLGFYHMQSTYDRDNFIKIEWDNIRRGAELNFGKYNLDTVTDFGVEYDYGSLMHYPENAFSKNGKNTITPLEDGVIIGQRGGMSPNDILKLNKMYCEKESFSLNEFFIW